MQTAAELVHQIQQTLSQISNPWLEAELIVAHALNISREGLTANPEKQVDPQSFKDIFKLAGLRANGMPLAYILGYKEFYGIKLVVNENVLIPRPETEMIVDIALAHLKNQRVIGLDIATGSGCIPIALLSNHNNSAFSAVDISDKAIQVAEINAKLHSVADRLKFVQADMNFFTPIKKYNLITSNPPYVTQVEYLSLAPELHHEPKIALVPLKNDFSFINPLAQIINNNLQTGGGLALIEINSSNAHQVLEMFMAELDKDKYLAIELVKDLAGHNRFIKVIS